MAAPQIEEVSDSDEEILAEDPDEMDLDTFDFARPQGTLAPSSTTTTTTNPPPSFPTSSSSSSEADRARLMRAHQERVRAFQCIYPVYFDAGRSREQGRRVAVADAVANPLAREIVDALRAIGDRLGVPLQVALDPMKTHPKDWANPGRVKVLVKEDGRAVHAKIRNKSHLYKLIAEYLQSHPTTPDAPLKMQIQGLPMPKDGAIIPPAIPRGVRMGSILPLHSPAMSSGPISDNFIQDMMQEMGGGGGMPGLPPGLLGGGGPSAPPATKKVKEKKKK